MTRAAMLKAMQAQEESMGPRGFPLVEKGTYAATVSEEKSDIYDGNGFPSLKLAVVLHDTPDTQFDNVPLSGFNGWYASPDGPGGAATMPKRTMSSRNMTKQFLNSLAIQALSNPDTDDDVANDIWDINTSLVALGDDPDPTEVRELFTSVAQVMDGVELLVYVSQRADKRDKTIVRNNYRIIVSPEKGTIDEQIDETWSNGLQAAGLDEN